jgi:cytoskeleton protein RodZ
MFQIGPSLREARTRRGLSAADVQKAIRIRERYLSALEDERWDQLPGDAYTKGFLRTYAEFLGLDGQLYVDEYNQRVGVQEEEPLVPNTLRRRGGGRDHTILVRSAVAVLLVAGLAAALAAWRHSDSPSRPTVQQASAAVAPAKKPVPPKKKPAVTHTAPRPTFTVIRAATGDSWLSVRIGGAAGRELYSGTLQQGGTLRYGLKQPIWIRMGRPPALDIRIGDTPVDDLPSAPANLLLTRDGPRSA